MFDYGKKTENPVDSVLFYRDRNDITGSKIRSDRVSHMLPTVFSERIIRVYSRNPDEAVVAMIQAAFRYCLRQYKYVFYLMSMLCVYLYV